jgi:hypothetical protein
LESVLANSYSVLTGQTATLECVITANPAATSVQWYKVVGGQQQAITSSPGSNNYYNLIRKIIRQEYCSKMFLFFFKYRKRK